VALVTSASNSFAISKIQERQALNVWSDQQAVAERTKCLVARGSSEDIQTLAVVAPAWSYGGVAIRIASPVTGDVLYQPELQISALTDSGVHLKVFANNAEQQIVGVFMKEWSRVLPSAAMLDEARKGGLTVRVECEVGEWIFRMTPTYFRGYEAKLAELQAQSLRAHLSDEHQPASK
jgi:hypothetical protein